MMNVRDVMNGLNVRNVLNPHAAKIIKKPDIASGFFIAKKPNQSYKMLIISQKRYNHNKKGAIIALFSVRHYTIIKVSSSISHKKKRM
jgi:hypothetical protein